MSFDKEQWQFDGANHFLTFTDHWQTAIGDYAMGIATSVVTKVAMVTFSKNDMQAVSLAGVELQTASLQGPTMVVTSKLVVGLQPKFCLARMSGDNRVEKTKLDHRSGRARIRHDEPPRRTREVGAVQALEHATSETKLAQRRRIYDPPIPTVNSVINLGQPSRRICTEKNRPASGGTQQKHLPSLATVLRT